MKKAFHVFNLEKRSELDIIESLKMYSYFAKKNNDDYVHPGSRHYFFSLLMSLTHF